MPRFFQRNAQQSAVSSIFLVVGVPAPCPERVSIRIKIGAGPPWAACRAAPNLKLCIGTTRSSVSAVGDQRRRVGGAGADVVVWRIRQQCHEFLLVVDRAVLIDARNARR